MGTKAQLGQISERELWLWVAEQLNLTSEDLEVFRNDFWADDLVDSDLVDLIKELRPDYQTAIISNATESLRTNLAETHEIADVFDLIVCSAEEGIMKPDQDIYLRTLTRLNRPAIDCLFIDDTEVNVNAARALGIQTIHFNSDVNMSMEFRNLGVGPGGIR
jgi:putative hydrolase of the HAD superfamily